MDTGAVRALAMAIVGGAARVVDAQAQILQLVPQADAGPHPANASTPAADPGAPDTGELAALRSETSALDAAVATLPQISVQLSPQWFGEQLVAGALESPAPTHEVLGQLAYETGLVVQLLEEADKITALVNPGDAEQRTSAPTTDAGRQEATSRLEYWKSRPINFMFLQRALSRRGVWQQLQGARDHRGHTPADLERKVHAQSMETGRTTDVGAAWDASEAHEALSVGMTDWKVTDDEALRVFDMLTQAEPRARGALVKQLWRMGRLEAMCEHLPWQQVKQLWESIPDPAAAKLLEPYWANKGGGASLGKRLEAQDHWYARGLNRFLNVATLGGKPRIDAAYDAREAGLITDDGYRRDVGKSVARTAAVSAVAAATGGAAGELVAGAAEGAGFTAASMGLAGRAAVGAASGGVGGGVGNVAGHLVGDIYDQVLDGKQGFDSLSDYGTSFKQGALLGGVIGGVGLAASKYLPPGGRSLAQQAAAEQPQMIRLLEAARSAGFGAGTRIRATVGELTSWFGNGGPPGFRLAPITAGVLPPRLAKSPPDTPIWITVRPLTDLNVSQPMQMGRGDDLVEVSPESGSLFDSHGDEASYQDEPVAGEDNAMDEASHAEREPIGIAEPTKGGGLSDRRVRNVRAGAMDPHMPEQGVGVSGARDAGVVAEPGALIVDLHHVFPQASKYAKWFAERGVDIHDYCLELTPPEHQAQHGGGSWTLARKVARTVPDVDWSEAIMKRLKELEASQLRATGNPELKLLPDTIVDEASRLMKVRGLEGARFVRYKGSAQ